MKISLFVVLAIASSAGLAQERTSLICTYAPSQSSKVAAVAGATTGGAAATAGAIAAATGLTVVAHSSGAYILTGSAGYIAGTIGGTAAAMAAAPFIVGAGILVGGAAVTVELVCAKENHPEQVAKVHEAAQEFGERFQDSVKRARAVTSRVSQSVKPAVGGATARVKKVSGDVWQYAFRRSGAVGARD
jgi:hypothetical protein